MTREELEQCIGEQLWMIAIDGLSKETAVFPVRLISCEPILEKTYCNVKDHTMFGCLGSELSRTKQQAIKKTQQEGE